MLQIIDYSEKAIAVIGTEKGNQEQITALKGMKGKYNPSLRCGKGWVFSKAKNGEQVTAWVAMWNAAHPNTPSAPQTPAPKRPQTPKPQPTAQPTPQQSSPDPAPQPQPQSAPTIQAAPPIELVEDELEGAPF